MENSVNHIISDKFISSEVITCIAPDGKTYNVKKDIKQLLATEEEGGLFDYRDPTIVDWFGNVNFTFDTPVSGRVQRARKSMIHKDIIAEGQKLGIYKEYNIVEALLLANDLVKAGEVEERNNGIIIYLSDKCEDVSCTLNVLRDIDGCCGVDVFVGRPKAGCFAGYGVLFRK